jgi:hypothetical protein
MVTEMELFESQSPGIIDFSLGRCVKSEVYLRSLNKHDLLARILDAVARIKEREDQFRQKKRPIFGHKLQSALTLTV